MLDSGSYDSVEPRTPVAGTPAAAQVGITPVEPCRVHKDEHEAYKDGRERGHLGCVTFTYSSQPICHSTSNFVIGS
jgi:hypothetical protein